jgi:riboflavin synthase
MLQNARFNLNDIVHEPSDEQLDALMEAVVVRAREHAEVARRQLLTRLRAEMTAVDGLRSRV